MKSIYTEVADVWISSTKGKTLISLWAVAGLAYGVFALKSENDAGKQDDTALKVEVAVENHLWKIKHRLYPSFSCQVAKFTALIPVTMGVWYASRIRSKQINTKVIIGIVEKNWDFVIPATIDLALWSIPAALGSKLMSWAQKRLSIAIRSQLTHFYQIEYLNSSPFYLKSLLFDPEQRITADVDKFSDNLSDLMHSICWVGGGIVVVSYSLISKMGLKEFLLAIGYSSLSRQLIQLVSPSFSFLMERIQASDGQFRSTHSKISEYAEEIDFYKGGTIEQKVLEARYNEVEDRSLNFLYSTLVVETVGGYFTAELGNLVGLMSIVPALYNDVEGEGDAIGYLAQVLQELFFLTKMYDKVFRIGKYVAEVNGLSQRLAELEDALESAKALPAPIAHDSIQLQNVDVVTPDGVRLIENITLNISQGQSTFVEGPNGSGKTSLFRVIGGLWRPNRGTVQKPTKIFYLSQRPYMVPGVSLKQQVCYPHDARNFDDSEVLSLLDFVGLQRLAPRLEEEFEFYSFSGGEKQRLSISRLLLHKPKFALLDECTAAISKDFEKEFFQRCNELDITLVTISHTPSVAKYHSQTLKLLGDGKWELK